MVEDARRASFGLIFLLLVGALHRYADFAAHYEPSQPTHSAAPTELGAGLAQAASSPSSPVAGAATGTPEQQWLAAGGARTAALAADISERQNRLAKLRRENEYLKQQQDSMLAAIGSGAATTSGPASGLVAPAPVSLLEALPMARGAPLQQVARMDQHVVPATYVATPSSTTGATVPAAAEPVLDTPSSTDAAAATAAATAVQATPTLESSNLRGSGLGAAAARAFSAAMSRATGAAPQDSSAAVAVAAPAAAATEQFNAPGRSASAGSSSGGLAGMVVAFRSSSTKLALTVDEKGWVQADRDAGSSLSSRSFEVVDAGTC